MVIQGPRQRNGVPAKVYEYLGARRPILALAEPGSDTAWVLRESGALHRLVPPGDVPAIRRGLLELVDAIQHNQPAPPSARLNCFTRQHSALLIARLLDECVRRPFASWNAPPRQSERPVS